MTESAHMNGDNLSDNSMKGAVVNRWYQTAINERTQTDRLITNTYLYERKALKTKKIYEAWVKCSTSTEDYFHHDWCRHTARVLVGKGSRCPQSNTDEHCALLLGTSPTLSRISRCAHKAFSRCSLTSRARSSTPQQVTKPHAPCETFSCQMAPPRERHPPIGHSETARQRLASNKLPHAQRTKTQIIKFPSVQTEMQRTNLKSEYSRQQFRSKL